MKSSTGMLQFGRLGYELPWIDDELRVLMRQRDWLHKKAIKSGDDDLWDIYRAARNNVNAELKRSKAEYFHGLCSNSKKHASQLWKHINELLSRNSKAVVESVCIGNSETSDPESVAEVLNNHFISAAGVLPSTETEMELPASPTISTTFRIKTVTQDTVLELIRSLDPRKSSGPGDISTRCLKLAAPGIVAPLTTIFNQSLTLGLGRVPAVWKRANVAPVFKKGDRTDPNNYRPISVIPVVGKILERIVYQQTLHHLLKKKQSSHIPSVWISTWSLNGRCSSSNH